MVCEFSKSTRSFVSSKENLIVGIAREREVHSRVQELVICGVRPKVIYRVIGKQMSLNEVKRIHDSITPLPPAQRHGRNIKFENIHKISTDANLLYIECFGLVKRARSFGASRADALCSSWRIMVDRMGVPFHSDINGCSCEEMIVLYLNLEVDELTIENCNECRSPFLSSRGYRCMACLASQKRKKLAA